MWRSELLDSQNSLASLSKMVRGGAAHRAEAEDDRVERHSVNLAFSYEDLIRVWIIVQPCCGQCISNDLESQLDVFTDTYPDWIAGFSIVGVGARRPEWVREAELSWTSCE